MTLTGEPDVRTGDGPLSVFARPITYRGDIEGLRAVAVLLVLVDHAGLPLTGGYVGVDVFFVISGFLITSLLVSELVARRRVSLRAFYGRRARRLLPGAVAVLLGTALLTLVVVPRTRWLDIAYDIGASAIYAENWRLADLAVDYQAQSAAASPLQHFWSLAVEEQFYLLWPLLFLAVGALVRYRWLGRAPRAGLVRADPAVQRRVLVAVVVAVALVAVPSLVWSVLYTAENPSGAYFVTTTRLWELAVGGATALGVGALGRMPSRVAAALGWSGLLAIAVAAVLYTSATPFPGTAALLPVLGTAAVLAAGVPDGGAGPQRVLDVAPMRWLGKLSYSLYLWHWPIVIVVATVVGERSVLLGVLSVALSFVPAYLSYRYLEDPVRRSATLRRDPEKSLAVGLACTATAMVVAAAMIIGISAASAGTTTVPMTLDQTGAAAQDTPRVGAMVLADDPRDDPAGAPVDIVPRIDPDPLNASSDLGTGFCGAGLTETAIRTCTLGDTASPVEIALIGDSHAQQWTTPLGLIARQRGWRLTAYTKAACPFLSQDVAISANGQETGDVGPGARAYTECATWRDEVVQRLTLGPNPPRMIVVSSGEHVPVVNGGLVGGGRGTDLLAQGFRDIWGRFQARGTQVVALADTPVPDRNMPDCVAANTDRLTRCSYPREEANSADGSALVAAGRSQPGVTLIDLSDAVCPTERCAPVIGGVLVYRDSNHLSATYAASLAPRLGRLLPQLR